MRIGVSSLLIVIGAAVMATLVLLAVRMRAEPPPVRGDARPATVVVSRAAPQVFPDTVESIGTARALESVEVMAKVTDRVVAIRFRDGMLVKKGDILVELSSSEDIAALAEAEATLIESRQQFERISKAAANGDMPVFERDEAWATLKVAEARVEGVKARLADRIIRAPFSGLLGFRQVSPGAMVSANSVITTLDDIHEMNVDFSISENHIVAIRPGQTVKARSAGYRDRVFTGVVTTIGSRVDPATRTITVRTRFANHDLALKPGMLLSIDLVRSERESLAIPEEALVPSAGRQTVFVVEDGSRLKQVEVTTGQRRDGMVEVLGGIEGGTTVVIRGASRARDGQVVEAVSDDAARSSAAIAPRTG